MDLKQKARALWEDLSTFDTRAVDQIEQALCDAQDEAYERAAKIAMEMDCCISGEEYCGKDISDAILTLKSKGETE